MKVFVSYRRSDSAQATGRIYDRLVAALGREQVFKDVDSLPVGYDFRKHIDASVAACDVMLVVIGPQWVKATDAQGRRRLDDPTDFVRIELESALARDIPIIPLLLEDASMPTAENLPSALADIAFRHAAHVRNDPEFHTDMDRLLRGFQSKPPNTCDARTIPATPPSTFKRRVFNLIAANSGRIARALATVGITELFFVLIVLRLGAEKLSLGDAIMVAVLSGVATGFGALVMPSRSTWLIVSAVIVAICGGVALVVQHSAFIADNTLGFWCASWLFAGCFPFAVTIFWRVGKRAAAICRWAWRVLGN